MADATAGISSSVVADKVILSLSKIDRSSFWIRIGKIDEYVLSARDLTWRLWPDRKPYVTFLWDIHSVLCADQRFSHLRWFGSELPSSGGAWFPGPADA